MSDEGKMSVRDVSIDLRLLKSARDEFLKQGFIKAELKTICENAGVTTGAVYKRYKGKEELFCAVVQETVDTLKAYVEGNTAPSLKDMTDDEKRDAVLAGIEKAILCKPIAHSFTKEENISEKHAMSAIGG